MLGKLFGTKANNPEEIQFLQKLGQYLLKNCRAVYGFEYIPRLVQRICGTRGIKVTIKKGFVLIKLNGFKYTIPYYFNGYKDQVLDLGLFVLRDGYKEINNNNEYIYVFKQLPAYIVPSINRDDYIPNNIEYIHKYLIMGSEFQPTEVMTGDELLLSVYNNCCASNIAHDIMFIKMDSAPLRATFHYLKMPMLNKTEQA